MAREGRVWLRLALVVVSVVTALSLIAVAPVAADGTSVRTSILDIARDHLGDPYMEGAAGPDSFDCSGLVNYCYYHSGISALEPDTHGPRAADLYYGYCNPVAAKSELRPGDLVFYGDLSHVGICTDTDSVIDAQYWSGYQGVAENGWGWDDGWVLFGRVRSVYWPGGDNSWGGGGPPPNPPVLHYPPDGSCFIGHPRFHWTGGGGGSDYFRVKFGGHWSAWVTGAYWRPESDGWYGSADWSAQARNEGGESDLAPGWALSIYRPESAFDAGRGEMSSWTVANDISGAPVPNGGVLALPISGEDSQIVSTDAYFLHGGQTTPGEWFTYNGDPYVQVTVEGANHTDIPWSKVYIQTGDDTAFSEGKAVPICTGSNVSEVQAFHATFWFPGTTKLLRFDPVSGLPTSNPFGDGPPRFDLQAIRFLQHVTWPKWAWNLGGNRMGWVTYGVSPATYPVGGAWTVDFTVDHPYMYTPKLQIHGEDWAKMRFTMANDTTVSVARVYYKASEGGDWLTLEIRPKSLALPRR